MSATNSQMRQWSKTILGVLILIVGLGAWAEEPEVLIENVIREPAADNLDDNQQEDPEILKEEIPDEDREPQDKKAPSKKTALSSETSSSLSLLSEVAAPAISE